MPSAARTALHVLTLMFDVVLNLPCFNVLCLKGNWVCQLYDGISQALP